MEGGILGVEEDKCYNPYRIGDEEREEVLEWNIEKKERKKQHARDDERQSIEHREEIDDVLFYG